MNIPRCAICGKKMINAIDSQTNEVSIYLWRYNCEHNNNDIRLSLG